MTRRFLVQVRVSEEEKARMESLASDAGVKLSEWVRVRALGEAPVRGAGVGVDAVLPQAPGSTPGGVSGPEPPRAPVPGRSPIPPMQRARDLLGRDSAAMDRQRKMNKSKGLD